MRKLEDRSISDLAALLNPRRYQPTASSSMRLPPTSRADEQSPGADGIAPMAVLVYEQGQMIAAVGIESDQIEIGRSPVCGIRVRDPSVSRRHCVLMTVDGNPTLLDLCSANGTVVDGRRVESVVVTEGATATVGRVVLKFVRVGSPEWHVHCVQFRQIYTDEHTGLLNRRGLRMRTEAWHASASADEFLGLLMLDIDHFKAVNDGFGHLAGDAVIEHVASMIHELVPANGCAARLGGEEFAVFFTDCSLEQLEHVAEQLRSAVELNPAIADGNRIPATISIGGSLLSASEEALRPMFVEADSALYEAKAAGRNRCSIRRQSARPVAAEVAV